MIRRKKYLVPNSLVISRGCPHHCDFCYKDAFYAGGKSFYTRRVDEILAEIETLQGKHLYFLDDHLLGNPELAKELFQGMRGMGRVFQGAATVASILKGDLIKQAVKAGLRSLFVGFETFSQDNLRQSNKKHNLQQDYEQAVKRLHDLGVMINGSFVFGLDHDGPDVFERTVAWGVKNSLVTAIYHILTPYPGTRLFADMEHDGRIMTRDWELYDTRHVVYATRGLSADALEQGYWWAYKQFYSWQNIFRASFSHESLRFRMKHLFYIGGWKKFETFWSVVINFGGLGRMLPVLELLLANKDKSGDVRNETL